MSLTLPALAMITAPFNHEYLSSPVSIVTWSLIQYSSAPRSSAPKLCNTSRFPVLIPVVCQYSTAPSCVCRFSLTSKCTVCSSLPCVRKMDQSFFADQSVR